MLPTFVIGLREGLEAALIVGIVAAFLRREGRPGALRAMWAGVGAAVLICLGVGIGLDVLAAELPQREQEALETVIGLVAVALVTYMIVWMRRHARDLRGQLEGAAGAALAGGSTVALATMAFLSVLREGFETSVFLLATFQAAGSTALPALGAVLGLVVAVGLGWGIYRGGVRIDLGRFFTATGLVLVLVAAGLLMTAAHTAHEAGWLDAGQAQALDLSWLVQPGSVRASLLTGLLGFQPRPTVVEVALWSAYVVVVGGYVLAGRQGRRRPTRAAAGRSDVVRAASA